jgi:hypothetical protein
VLTPSPLKDNRAERRRAGTSVKFPGLWIGLLLGMTVAVVGLSSDVHPLLARASRR